MKHPLTDEMCEGICEQVSQDCDWHATQNEIWSQTLRAAADWQLEQVTKWLGENLYYIQEDGLVRYVYGDDFATIASHEVITDLKKAMRPQ